MAQAQAQASLLPQQTAPRQENAQAQTQPTQSPQPQPQAGQGSPIPAASTAAAREKLVRRAARGSAPATAGARTQLPPEVARALSVEQTIQDYLRQAQVQRLLSKLLGRWMSPERMLALAVTVIRQNPDLLSCEVPSLVGALVYCAQLRLMPGPVGHVYFVPFMDNRRGVRQVQPILGYRGLAELARRSGQLVAIHGGIVREGDTFRYRLGTQPFLEHVLAADMPKDPKELPPATHYYIVAYYRSGIAIPHVLTPAQIEWHRQFSKAKDSSFWATHYDAMALKTVVRDAAWRWLPLSLEGQYALTRDEQPIESPEELEAVTVEGWAVEETSGPPAVAASPSAVASAQPTNEGVGRPNELF